MHQCSHENTTLCRPGQPGYPHETHTPPRRKTPSRPTPSVIVVTPPRASDSDFTLDDHRRSLAAADAVNHVGLCQTVNPKRRGGGSSDFDGGLHRRKLHTLHRRNPRGHCRKSVIVASLSAPRHAAPTSQLHSGTQHGLSVTKDMPRPGSAHHRHRCHTARNATIAPKTSSAAANHDVV